ncbi:MAG: tRNA (adenosine(37)-N6)-threonylcarbamoyltransferase complex transferase subunit TsaD [Candidatus Cloacimonadota bacterium]|nr:tRNA (adenosine(37)-N6)-threonylcarbamoyltransferase complex transferase subunit TsaD [Candidatus Cloacimonadota bacterium]
MNKKILAFESSCDDTSVAIVESNYKVLVNFTSAQPEHAKFGGVVPEVASRLHIKNVMQLTKNVLLHAKLNLSDIDAVAVSVNPGLIGSLLVGVSYAKSLAYSLDIPLIAVNHILGHIYANKISNPDLEPPFLALIVSGGHTELVNFKTTLDFDVVGRTRDDAAGEAFDKTAILLNLGYPGGPIIDRKAKKGDPNFYKFPRAMNRKDNFDFSFSGLKTAIMNYIKSHDSDFIQNNKNNIAASVQNAITDSLFNKTTNYAKKHRINKIVIAGGVSANSNLRQKFDNFSDKSGCKVFYPELQYCMDNAAMIGAAAVPKLQRKEFADLTLNAFSTKGIRRI